MSTSSRKLKWLFAEKAQLRDGLKQTWTEEEQRNSDMALLETNRELKISKIGTAPSESVG